MRRIIVLMSGILAASTSLPAQISKIVPRGQVDTVGNYAVYINPVESPSPEASYTTFWIDRLGFELPDEYSEEKHGNYYDYRELYKSTHIRVAGSCNRYALSSIILSHLSERDRERAKGKMCVYSVVISKSLELFCFRFTIYFKDSERKRPMFSNEECIEIFNEVESAKLFQTWNNDIEYLNVTSWLSLKEKEKPKVEKDEKKVRCVLSTYDYSKI